MTVTSKVQFGMQSLAGPSGLRIDLTSQPPQYTYMYVYTHSLAAQFEIHEEKLQVLEESLARSIIPILTLGFPCTLLGTFREYGQIGFELDSSTVSVNIDKCKTAV